VIDAWPAADTHQVAQLSIPGEPTRLFLSGDKLVVYARTGSSGGGTPSAAQGCTYGYECRFQTEPGATSAQVFDVSTPETPRELARYDFSGGYVTSRRIGNVVYTVVADQGVSSAPGVDLSLTVSDPAQLDTVYQQKLLQADTIVDGLADEYFLPWVRVSSGQTEPPTPLACDGGLVAQAASGESFTSLVSFDLATLAAPQRALVATKPGFVYASATALYVATDGATGADDRYFAPGGPNEQSSIHKFALNGLATPYRGSTLIPGHVLNQFSMDEQASVLRVATSSGWVPAPDVSSNIVTLTEQAGQLQIVGQLNGLAPNEDIRSVRFDGERGFVVTFKKTDPLFVIDLLDPAKPSVLGELKIPGFSTYMQPMDKDHVLAIGLDADDQGSFAFFNGIQLQIFDVSDLSNPKLQHKTVIGTRGSASDALTNHLAFNYFAPKGLLALPMTICDGGGNGTFGDKLSFSGLMVFDVSLSTGIAERGRMPFVESAALASTIPSCSSWWTDSSSAVKRSIIMDDFVIGLSDAVYQVAALGKLDSVLQSIPLTP
jgi:Beta propeller domain